jgi:sarcosine oxidase subunit alpha
MTPHDVGMGGLVAKSKDVLGTRSLTRSDTAMAGRKQLVGLLADDPSFVIPEGSQIVAGPFQGETAPMLGHVTSSYYSPILKRSIAMAVVKGGLDKIGETVTVPLSSGKQIAAKITSSVFYDSEGARQHVE